MTARMVHVVKAFNTNGDNWYFTNYEEWNARRLATLAGFLPKGVEFSLYKQRLDLFAMDTPGIPCDAGGFIGKYIKTIPTADKNANWEPAPKEEWCYDI